MKTRNFIAIVASMSVLVFASSCGSQKQVAENAPAQTSNPFGNKLTEPMSSPQYKSDTEFFRAVGSGSSPDLEMAKNIAALNARAELAGFVKTYVEEFIKDFSYQYGDGENKEYADKAASKAFTAVQQDLNGAVNVGTELYQLDNGEFMYWICIEMSRNPVNEEMKELISNDEKLATDFQEFQFDKEIDEFKAQRAEAENNK